MASIPLPSCGNEPHVLGLDIGTFTGIARLTHSGKILTLDAKDFSKATRYQRWKLMRNCLSSLIAHNPPTLVVIEGYGYANANSLATLVEYGTTYRQCLIDYEVNFIEVPPTSVKSFVVGGAAKKDEMRLEAYKKWGIEHKSNDAVDAYCMAQVARAVLGHEKITQKQHTNLLKIAGVKEIMQKTVG